MGVGSSWSTSTVVFTAAPTECDLYVCPDNISWQLLESSNGRVAAPNYELGIHMHTLQFYSISIVQTKR